jgi:hypothetical protein
MDHQDIAEILLNKCSRPQTMLMANCLGKGQAQKSGSDKPINVMLDSLSSSFTSKSFLSNIKMERIFDNRCQFIFISKCHVIFIFLNRINYVDIFTFASCQLNVRQSKRTIGTCQNVFLLKIFTIDALCVSR